VFDDNPLIEQGKDVVRQLLGVDGEVTRVFDM
jgi:hypothetical protein